MGKFFVLVLNMLEEKVYKYIIKKIFIEKILFEGWKIFNKKVKEIKVFDLKGVYVVEDSICYYLYGSFLFYVFGFVGIDNQGFFGLEVYYDDDLKGVKGFVKFYIDVKGKKMLDEVDDYIFLKDGFDMKLMIDVKVQMIIEREFDNAVVKYNLDGMIVVVMNLKNGEVFGMLSCFDFDLVDY